MRAWPKLALTASDRQAAPCSSPDDVLRQREAGVGHLGGAILPLLPQTPAPC